MPVANFWPRNKSGWLTAVTAGLGCAATLWILYRTAGAFIGLPVPAWLNLWPLWQQLTVAAAAVAGSGAFAAWLLMREQRLCEYPPGFAPAAEYEPPTGPYDSPRTQS